MRTVIDHTMYCGTAVTDFIEAMGGKEYTKFFVTSLWMRAAHEDAADGIIKITPSRLKRDLLDYEISPDVYMRALQTSGLIVPVEGRPDYFYLTNWNEINGEYYRSKARQAQYMRDYRARHRTKKHKQKTAHNEPHQEPENNVKGSRKPYVKPTQGSRKDNVSGSVSGSGSGSVAVSGSGSVAGSPNQDHPDRNTNFQKTLEAATTVNPPQLARLTNARAQGDSLDRVYLCDPPPDKPDQALAKVEAVALGDGVVEHPKAEKSRRGKVRTKFLATPLPKPATGEHLDIPMPASQIEALLLNTYGMSDIGAVLAANTEFIAMSRERAFTWSELNHAVEEARHNEAGEPGRYLVTVLVNARKEALKARTKREKSVEELTQEALSLIPESMLRLQNM